MSRYIDADKMLEVCTKYIASVFPKSYEFAKQDAELLIATAPSIDIVRCGECIYWKNSLCQAWHRVIPKDGYCSIGERDGSIQTETQNSNLTFEKADEPQTDCPWK